MIKKISLVSDGNLEPLERIINSNSKKLKARKFTFSAFDYQMNQKTDGLMLVWLNAENIFLSVNKFHQGELINFSILKKEIKEFVSKLVNKSKSSKVFLVSFINIHELPFSNNYLSKGKNSVNFIYNFINNHIVEEIDNNDRIEIIDINQLLYSFKGDFFDNSFYIATKSYFTIEFYKFFYNFLEKLISALKTVPKKLIILDLDDTLWGGTIGEDGMENLVLGGNNIFGEAFKNFQKKLLFLKNHGLQLAIVSKNENSVAMNAINNHSEMILRKKDFSIIKINWKRKVENIISISEELNLGLDSFVFFDNEKFERQEVAENLPAVLTPDISSGVLDYVSILNSLKCFNISRQTKEDKNRTKYYKDNAKRNHLLKDLPTKDDWIKKLKIKIVIQYLNKQNIVRVVQLLNKTNQMNMRTNRYDLSKISQFLKIKSQSGLITATVKDKFGDYGLTGILSYVKKDSYIEIIDFVLSCRVMGRGIEEYLIRYIKKKFINKNIKFDFKTSEKNKPMYNFLKKCNLLKENSKNKFLVYAQIAKSKPKRL